MLPILLQERILQSCLSQVISHLCLNPLVTGQPTHLEHTHTHTHTHSALLLCSYLHWPLGWASNIQDVLLLQEPFTNCSSWSSRVLTRPTLSPALLRFHSLSWSLGSESCVQLFSHVQLFVTPLTVITLDRILYINFKPFLPLKGLFLVQQKYVDI